jgi:hypothetical protein
MSMGSSVDKLTLDAAYTNDFLVAYAASASAIRLERLVLHGSLAISERPQGGDEGDSNRVCSIKTHLPNIVHLRELSVSVSIRQNNQQARRSAAEAAIAKDLVSAVRHNGSLRHLEINSSQTLDAAPILTNKQKRLVKAFLQRNEHVPKMLNRPCFDGMKAAPVVTNGCEDSNNTPTHPSFFPALYRVMDPAQRMLPNTIVTGLLALGDYE